MQYSNTGSCFVVAGGDERARMYDRDGKEIQVFAKGDMYISDLNHTKGHTAAITKIFFDPSNHERMLTSSRDSSMRIWDIEDPTQQVHVLKIVQGKGRRVAFTTCAYGLLTILVFGVFWGFLVCVCGVNSYIVAFCDTNPQYLQGQMLRGWRGQEKMEPSKYGEEVGHTTDQNLLFQMRMKMGVTHLPSVSPKTATTCFLEGEMTQ